MKSNLLFLSSYLFTAVVEDIFKIGSMAPGAMLYEASREFQVSGEKIQHFQCLIGWCISLFIHITLDHTPVE